LFSGRPTLCPQVDRRRAEHSGVLHHLSPSSACSASSRRSRWLAPRRI